MSHIKQSHRPARGRWIFWGFLAIAGFYLFTEHRSHLASVSWPSWLPFGILLLCPLLHMGMHGGQHRHGGPSREKRSPLPDRPGLPGASDTPSPHMHGLGPEDG